MLSNEEIVLISSKLKIDFDDERVEWFKDRPYWQSHHCEINEYIRQYLPNTHIVPMPDDKKYYENFITKSKFYVPLEIKYIKMKRSCCHENCERMLTEGKIDKWMFGYALSRDGLFRTHSWGVKNEIIVETTEKRLLYFGYDMYDL
jgi:hypothetical protein